MLPVDPSAVKKEPLDEPEAMDEGGGGAGDGVGVGSGGERSGDEQGSAPPPDAPAVPKKNKDSQRPDWNARWRSKTLKQTSWRERLGGGLLNECRQAMLEAELSNPLAIGSAESVSEEPGAQSDGAAGSSGGGDTGKPAGIFRVGRKVVTKQMDGSAAPAVKVMRQDRRGQPKVAFLDHKTALRQAVRMDRVYQQAQCQPDSTPEPRRPAKRKRPPRVLTKPPAGEPPALPSEVAWMAADTAGAAHESWPLVADGAVHAVLEVQPGDDWVDAIVRSEAAGEWAAGQSAQLPVPLDNIKREPPERPAPGRALRDRRDDGGGLEGTLIQLFGAAPWPVSRSSGTSDRPGRGMSSWLSFAVRFDEVSCDG